MTISDNLVRRVVLFAMVLLSYGQAGAITALRLSDGFGSNYPIVYPVLVNQEEYGKTSWFSVCGALHWILTFGGLCIRYKEHYGAIDSLPSNHLFLKQFLKLGASIGLALMLFRRLTWNYIDITSYAQLICYVLLVLIILIIFNHDECLQFSIRKLRTYPVLSVWFNAYDTWMPILRLIKQRNSSVQPIELIVWGTKNTICYGILNIIRDFLSVFCRNSMPYCHWESAYNNALKYGKVHLSF